MLENYNRSQLQSPKWREVFKAYAYISTYSPSLLSQLEGLNFGHVISEEYIIFTIRFHSGLKQDMRIAFQEKFFEIKRIINQDMQNQVQKIITLEI